jgi:phage-related minor tail protein
MAGIPYVGPALGVAAAAAAIAAGMANVQAIRAQPVGGYKQGGYTGNGGINQVAGAVHGREYVMDAQTTSRIGVGKLDALRSGDAGVAMRGSSSSGGGGNWGGDVKIHIKNYGTSKSFDVQQISREEIRIIARDEAREITAKEAPKVVAGAIGDANSSVSKAMAKNTNAARRR